MYRCFFGEKEGDVFNMSEPRYKRVLLKISGEALAGDLHRGLDFDVIGSVCDAIKECTQMGVQVGLMVGAGNFWRGVKDGADKMQRSHADAMGMLGTVMNSIAVADALSNELSPISMVITFFMFFVNRWLIFPVFAISLSCMSKYIPKTCVY